MDAGVAEKVRAAGGEIFAISSEPQVLSDRAKEEWRLNFETVGDPHHEIAEDCRKRGWLDLFVNVHLGFIRQSTKKAKGWEPTHPKGYFQPGVLAVAENGRVLYRWEGVPTHSNIGGAAGRPTADHVWSRTEEALGEGASKVDAELDADPPLDMRGVPWPLFVSLLVANGWFLTGRGFESEKQIGAAALKLLGFLTSWIVAFLWLPVIPVTLACLAWLAYIIPKVRWLGKEFQNEKSR